MKQFSSFVSFYISSKSNSVFLHSLIVWPSFQNTFPLHNHFIHLSYQGENTHTPILHAFIANCNSWKIWTYRVQKYMQHLKWNRRGQCVQWLEVYYGWIRLFKKNARKYWYIWSMNKTKKYLSKSLILLLVLIMQEKHTFAKLWITISP